MLVVVAATERTPVPIAKNSTPCSPHTWLFSSTRTPTMPAAPSRSPSSCIRFMASSRAE